MEKRGREGERGERERRESNSSSFYKVIYMYMYILHVVRQKPDEGRMCS